jgi:hypothetical protein
MLIIYKLIIEIFLVERNVEILIDLSLFGYGYNRVIIKQSNLVVSKT